MINVWFYLLVLAMCVNTFSISINYSSYDRTFMSLSNSIYENALVIVGEEEDFVPYFEKYKLEEDTISYLRNNLPERGSGSEISFYYYYPESNELCLEKCCRGVSISLRKKISLLCKYEKTLSFEVKQNVK